MNNFFIEHQCSPLEADAIRRNIKDFNDCKRKLRRTYTGLKSKTNRRITRKRLLAKAYPEDIPRIAHHAAHLAINPIAPDTQNDWMLVTGAEAGWIRNNTWQSKCGSIRIGVSLHGMQHKRIDAWPFIASDRRRCSWLGLNNNTLRIYCAHAGRRLHSTDKLSNSFNLISSCWTDKCLLPGESPTRCLPHILRNFSETLLSHNLDHPILAFELSKTDARLKIDGDTYRSISEHSDPHAMLLNATCAQSLVIHHGFSPREAWINMRAGKTARTVKWFEHQKNTSEFRLRMLKTYHKWASIQLDHGRSAPSIISALLFLSETIMAAGIPASTGNVQRQPAVLVHMSDSLNSLCRVTFGHDITSRVIMRLLDHAADYCLARDILTIEGAISLAHDIRRSISSKIPDSIFYLRTK